MIVKEFVKIMDVKSDFKISLYESGKKLCTTTSGSNIFKALDEREIIKFDVCSDGYLYLYLKE